MTHDPYAPPPEPRVPAVPPVQYTYGAPLYDVPPLRSAAGLGVAAIVLASVWTVVQVLELTFAPQGADALRRAGEAGFGGIDSEFASYDAVGLLSLPVQAAAYIVTCLWLYRSRSTAVAATPGWIHERSKVWVWLGWWVPFVSLWFPYQVVRDIRRATATGPVSGIGGWWAAWLVFIVGSNFAGRMVTSSTAEQALAAADALVLLEAVSTLAIIVALVLWIRIVRDITRFQAERIAAAERDLIS